MDRSKILIVEDDFDTLTFLKLFLGKKFDIEACRSDEEFYEIIGKCCYNLIIMDIAIKGRKDGLQITRELKSAGQYKNIPVLCLSAHVLEKDKENALKAGVDKFLPKPVSNQLLMETINSLISVDQLS
ncbi:MAG: response regulator [Ignavibacteriaceae bacterium]|nr:response regulator [Ignavibacteriaceae bacterium]